MKYKIYKFLGIERCDFCAKYMLKYLMKAIRTTNYIIHVCKDCWKNIKED